MSHTRSDHVGAVAKSRQAQSKRWRYAIGIFLALCAAAGVLFLVLYPRMYIVDVQITGFHLVDDIQVRETVQEHLDKKVLSIVPRWHRFLVGPKKLGKVLQNKFPIFSKVVITETNQILTVQVSERAASFVWCEIVPDTDMRLPACAYMDDTGFLFEQAPYFSQSTRIVFYTPLQSVGVTAVPQTTIAHVVMYDELLSKLGFKLNTIQVHEFDIDLVGTFAANRATSSKIIVKPEDDPQTAVSYVEVLFRDSEFVKDFKTKLLQYIDARSGKILYYRFD